MIVISSEVKVKMVTGVVGRWTSNSGRGMLRKDTGGAAAIAGPGKRASHVEP